MELGVDVGDLARVIQLDAPRTVASFLQRLGRSGRRPDTTRNCLLLCLDTDAVLHAAGLLLRWSQGWVEPVVAPPSPRHILAQQVLALALQEKAIGLHTWRRAWGGLAPFTADGDAVLAHLLAEGYLERDGDLAFHRAAGRAALRATAFPDLTAVFSAAPEFTVLAGGEEIGTVGDSALLSAERAAARVLLLAGRAWLVSSVDWKRRRCFVEPTELPGRARWDGVGADLSFTVTRGMREVLLGADLAGVILTRRGSAALARLRGSYRPCVQPNGTLLRRERGDLLWWTWAGAAANRTLHASLPRLVDPRQRIGGPALRLRGDLDPRSAAAALRDAAEADLVDPAVDPGAVSGLKFSAALPPDLATRTVAERLGDRDCAAAVLAEPRQVAY